MPKLGLHPVHPSAASAVHCTLPGHACCAAQLPRAWRLPWSGCGGARPRKCPADADGGVVPQGPRVLVCLGSSHLGAELPAFRCGGLDFVSQANFGFVAPPLGSFLRCAAFAGCCRHDPGSGCIWHMGAGRTKFHVQVCHGLLAYNVWLAVRSPCNCRSTLKEQQASKVYLAVKQNRGFRTKPSFAEKARGWAALGTPQYHIRPCVGR